MQPDLRPQPQGQGVTLGSALSLSRLPPAACGPSPRHARKGPLQLAEALPVAGEGKADVPKRKARRRAWKAIRRCFRRTAKSPKIRLLGLFVSILLVVMQLAELTHQLVSVVT